MGVAVSAALFLLATYIHVGYLAVGEGPVVYLVGRSFLELAFLMVVAPFVVARLRDLGWPVTLALILIPAWLFGPMNLTLYDAAWNTGNGLWGVPMIIGSMSSAAALLLAILLMIIRSGAGPAGAADS